MSGQVQPQLWIIAGLNGGGKSTVAKTIAGNLIPKDCLNPDAVTQGIIDWLIAHKIPAKNSVVRTLANWVAVVWVERAVRHAISRGESVSVETVLSTLKYHRHVVRAKSRGYAVGMIYVALSTVDLHIERVRLRVDAGGHNVSTIKIHKRRQLSLDNLFVFEPLVDRLMVFDNSDVFPQPPALVAAKTHGSWKVFAPQRLPEIVDRIPV